jgi:hypothetical protein
MVIVYNLSATIGMFCIYMFGLQVHLLSQSVTWHEFNSKTHVSKSQQILTAWSNFTTNFGHGLFHFVIPVVSGLLPYSKSKCSRVKSDLRIY